MTLRAGWEDEVLGLLTELAVGVVTYRLYSGDHPRAGRARARVRERLESLLGAGSRADEGWGGNVTLVALEQELFVQGRPFTRSGEQVGALARHLHRHGVERATFLPGVSDEELDLLFDFLAGPDAGECPALTHVRLGRVELQTEAQSEAGSGPPSPAGAVLRDRVRVVHDAFAAVAEERTLAVPALEEVVASLDHDLKRCEDPLTTLAALEDESLWPAVHAHNVAALTLALATPLELDSGLRRDLGLAALLHDIGKVGLPPGVVRQELGLDGAELELDLDHPRLGLERLLAVPLLSPVAPIVAFEHHIGWSGWGRPRLPERRRPHPAAAMVTVAETFDLMHTVRARRGRLSREAIGATLAEGAGVSLDPFFVRLMLLVWQISTERTAATSFDLPW